MRSSQMFRDKSEWIKVRCSASMIYEFFMSQCDWREDTISMVAVQNNNFLKVSVYTLV